MFHVEQPETAYYGLCPAEQIQQAHVEFVSFPDLGFAMITSLLAGEPL